MLPVTLLALVVVGFTLVLARETGPASSAVVVHGAGDGAPASLKPGTVPPDFSAVTFSGDPVQLSQLKGKAVLLNFFASWCVECRSEFPRIERAYIAHRGGAFTVLGVDAIDSGDGHAFYGEMRATFPALLDPSDGGKPGAIARAYGITTGLPVSVFIDPPGRVHRVYLGGIDEKVIAGELSAMGVP